MIYIHADLQLCKKPIFHIFWLFRGGLNAARWTDAVLCAQAYFRPLKDVFSVRFAHLGGTLQLVHGRIIRRLASGTFGGTNELSQSFCHIFHRVYQNHLEKRTPNYQNCSRTDN